MNTITSFTIFAFEVQIQGRALYAAYCTNGCGHGFAKTVEEAQDACIRRIGDLFNLYNEINMHHALQTKEQFTATTDPMEYGLDREKGWDTPDIQWMEMEYSEIMRRRDTNKT